MDIKDDEIRYLDPIERMRIYSERKSSKNKSVEKEAVNDIDESFSEKQKDKQNNSRSITVHMTSDFFELVGLCSSIKKQSLSSFVVKALEPYVSDILKNCDTESEIKRIKAETDRKISILEKK